MITNRALPVLANLCVLTDKFNRQYDKEFGQKGFKIGATANVRLPPRYLGTFGPALNVEPSTENYVAVSILYQYHVDIQFNTINMLLDIDEFEERFIHPACVTVANTMDTFGAYFAYQNSANRLGTPGTAPTSYKVFSDARALLVNEGMPKGLIPVSVLQPAGQSSMADSLKGLFNPQVDISELYETGMIAAKTAGADWFEDPNIAGYTTGTLTGAPVLAGVLPGAASGGTALLTSGWQQTGTLELTGLTDSAAQCFVGDTIQVAGIYPVNPQSRGRYNLPSIGMKQFVVLPPFGYATMTGTYAPGGPQFAAGSTLPGAGNGTFNAATGQYTSSSAGKLSVLVGECMITGGQFQNCAASSAFTGTPAVTLNGGVASGTFSTEHMYFHRDALCLATVDLPLPRTAVEASNAHDDDLGLTIRIATQYTINNDAEPTRMDIAFGIASLYRNLAARVSG